MKKLTFLIALYLFQSCQVLLAEDFSVTSTNEMKDTLYTNQMNHVRQAMRDANEAKLLTIPGVKWDSTIGPVASIGILKGRDCEYWVGQVEIGRDGGKLEIGFGEMQMTGGFLKLSALRTWDDPSHADPNQSYLGVELEFNLFVINLNAGIYRHIQGSDSSHDLLTTLGIGIGF